MGGAGFGAADGTLHEDEDVLLQTRPSWTALAPRVSVAVLVVAACLTGLVAWTSAPGWFGWVLLAAFLWAAERVGAGVLRWRSTWLVVTTDRIVYRSGVVRRFGREIPVGSVQDVSFRQSVFERVAGAGSVTVESAGERGALPFLDVPHPEQFQTVVNRAVAGGRNRRGDGSSRDAVRRATIPEQIEQLATLYRRGVLTEAEFERKKAQLLDRM